MTLKTKSCSSLFSVWTYLACRCCQAQHKLKLIFLEAIASLVVTFSLIHSVSHSVSHLPFSRNPYNFNPSYTSYHSNHSLFINYPFLSKSFQSNQFQSNPFHSNPFQSNPFHQILSNPFLSNLVLSNPVLFNQILSNQMLSNPILSN